MIKCRSPFDGRAKVSRSSISDTSSVLSKRRQSPLREFRRTRGVCLDVCRNAASATKNFLAFAGMLQVPRKTFWRLQHRCKSHEKLFGVCRNAANAAKNFLAFAGAPQTSRRMSGASRSLRKRLGKCRGTCAACANVSVNAGSLAQPAQTSRQMPGYLRGLRKRLGECREPRKCLEKLFGVCGSPASISKNVLAIAWLP